MRMSVSRISAPMNSRAFGRQSACCAKTGSSRFAALTSFACAPSPGALEQDPLVRHPRAVVDAVVDREPVAEILQHGAARRARDHAGTAG